MIDTGWITEHFQNTLLRFLQAQEIHFGDDLQTTVKEVR